MGVLLCSWCAGDQITVTGGKVDPHKIVEADTSSCPGSGRAPVWKAETLVLKLDGWDSNLARFLSDLADRPVRGVSMPTGWWLQRGQPEEIEVVVRPVRHTG